jgi:acyl-CoA synthetase (NDP forming)
MSIAAIVEPTGIAIVGASEDRYYARSLIENMLDAGFPEERLFPVHPRNESVLGIPCHASLTEIGRPVSLVIIATSAGTVENIVREAGGIGAEAAIVLADGYAEQGREGRERQASLVRTAEESGVRLLGPNTLGLILPGRAVAAWAPGRLRTPLAPGRIGVVFQSSGMLNLFLNLCIDRRIGLSAAFSVGNEASFDTADFVSFLADDPDTSVIGLLIETTTNPRRLAESLEKARVAGKAVIALKLGASERARANAIAHTGRLASSATSWNALLQRLGVVLVDDLDELVETLTLFSHTLDGNLSRREPLRYGFVTVSGGDCSLICDLAEALGVPIADLEASTHARLQELLEKPDLLGNPLDTESLLREDSERFYASVDALCGDPNVDVLVYRMYLPTVPTVPTKALYSRLVERARAAGKRSLVVTRAIEELDASWYEFFNELGVAFLPSYRPALRSLHHLSEWSGAVASSARLSLSTIPTETRPASVGAVSDWVTTQRIIERAGIPYASARLVQTPEEASAAAASLGFPVAAKLVSTSLAHKSDVGGVILGIGSSEEVEEAVRRLNRIAEDQGIVPEGIEIQMMAADAGVEMIVGVTNDASVGPLILVGMGGVFTEILQDVVLLVPDVSPGDVKVRLQELAGYPLLTGYRGRPPADVDALAEMLARLSAFICESPDAVHAMDLNPLLVGPQGKGVVAVDALVVTVAPSS